MGDRTGMEIAHRSLGHPKEDGWHPGWFLCPCSFHQNGEASQFSRLLLIFLKLLIKFIAATLVHRITQLRPPFTVAGRTIGAGSSSPFSMRQTISESSVLVVFCFGFTRWVKGQEAGEPLGFGQAGWSGSNQPLFFSKVSV